uniref:Deoxyribonuclease n=1 Tax=Mastacembelus armatus TaxID=205130 RepID=A0A7N8Y0X0_9TELE
MRLVCVLGFFLTLLHVSSSLLLGAFNIRSFGDKKASNSTVMDIISMDRNIVKRYDVILIQEVRDSDLSATRKLMEYKAPTFTLCYSPQLRYSHIVSEPLGRSSYKERYLFVYRYRGSLCVDPIIDTFSREPFVNFVLVPQHTSPEDAVKEINALYDVVADVRTHWNTNDIVLLGDFNAGCNYVKASDWRNIRLFTDESFRWLINNEADTTVSQTTCPYDRIVVTNDMMRGVVHSSAAVYNYMVDLNLSQNLALDISDHFPVEVRLTDQAAG